MNRILDILEDIRPDSNFRESSDFIADALLDSFDIMNLVENLEEEYDIKLDNMDILPENFSSLKALNLLVIKSGGKIV